MKMEMKLETEMEMKFEMEMKMEMKMEKLKRRDDIFTQRGKGEREKEGRSARNGEMESAVLCYAVL